MYRQKNRALPDRLPVEPNVADIPGCKRITYRKYELPGGEAYYRLTMKIHFREAVIYDSRHHYDSDDNWGTFKQMDGWAYTRD